VENEATKVELEKAIDYELAALTEFQAELEKLHQSEVGSRQPHFF
jgi:hypothetical protein